MMPTCIRFMMFQATQPCYTPLSLHNNVGADPDIFKGEQVLQRSKKRGWDDNYIYLLWHSPEQITDTLHSFYFSRRLAIQCTQQYLHVHM